MGMDLACSVRTACMMQDAKALVNINVREAMYVKHVWSRDLGAYVTLCDSTYSPMRHCPLLLNPRAHTLRSVYYLGQQHYLKKCLEKTPTADMALQFSIKDLVGLTIESAKQGRMNNQKGMKELRSP